MTARRVLAASAGATAVLVLAGCVTSGTVTEKSYRAPFVSCVGTPIVCTPIDACWRLHLLSERGDLGEVCVPRQEWEAADVGEFYDGSGAKR